MATAPKRKPVVCPPDINRYLLEHGRLPWLGDPVPPWHYRGWLLWQVQLCDAHPALPHRWQYYQQTIEAGRLLAEPIPRIEFADQDGGAATRMLTRCIDLIYRETGRGDFDRFVEWLAFGLAVGGARPPLSEATNEALYRSFDLEPLLTRPYDYFGHLLVENTSKRWNRNAFYPTPHSLVELMTRITFLDPPPGDGPDPRTFSVCDPAVGTGRMLLHASNHSLCLYGQDIDPLVCAITRVNGALYAPWLSFPFPASIIQSGIEPPPALLPIPQARDCCEKGNAPYRVDDRGQGLLF